MVDDDPAFLDLLETLLEDESYGVVTHGSSDLAYQLVKETAPDLVILDLWMAGASGGQVLDWLKGAPKTAGIPVLVCSAAGPDLLAAEARLREQGCDILAKPFDIDELLAKVQRWTGSAPA